ncbi:MAG: MgtC/SapB family protein [Nitrospinota bacterium]|nr:MgtC/SapB family protein [Nitrospinota bacterium]MDP7580537.1 MgtC/SapB family protein [Nitrospinota bacterium]HJN02818.1 MgtC/SapB family protein [Nitrospinota bacterium]
MGTEYLETILRLIFALFAGWLIGLERSYHGRPAGFRTHTCLFYPFDVIFCESMGVCD